MMVPVEGSMKNGDLPSVIVGLGVGLLDVLQEVLVAFVLHL